MEAGAFSSTETKAEGAILDLLKDVSQFNKKTLDNIQHNKTAAQQDSQHPTGTQSKRKVPEEASHVQLSSKIGQK